MNKKEEYIKMLWNEKAIIIQQKPITLKSGRLSHIYLNHRNLICLPDNMDTILSLFKENINKITNDQIAICNIGSSLSPIVMGALSHQMRIPFYYYRPINTEKGIKEDIFSYDNNPSSSFPSQLPVVLLDDVVTTTTTIKNTAQSLEELDIEVAGAVVLTDRRVLSEKYDDYVSIYPTTSLIEIIDYGLDQINLDNETRELLEIELETLK